jgi:hypothetical protein
VAAEQATGYREQAAGEEGGTCPSCATRYHGEQWCHDCNQPCTRIGLGGPCPHCDEPVTLTDLRDTTEPANR